MEPEMDLSIGELMQGAARNDERVLTCTSLWTWETRPGHVVCQQGINVPSVLEVLRQEAIRRGCAPRPSTERSPE
jgi:hypothetical protein